MKRAASKLSYANVMSSIAVFLVLGGATAFAASKVGPHRLKANSVTTPKIKANAVTTRKLRKNAVTRLKIRDGAINSDKLADAAVDTDKIANGAVTAAKIESAGMPFSRVTDRLRGTARLPFVAGEVYPLDNATYTQPTGRDDQYVAGFEAEVPRQTAEGCAGAGERGGFSDLSDARMRRGMLRGSIIWRKRKCE